MKRTISLLIVIIMAIMLFTACSENDQQKSAEPTGTVISNSEQQSESTSTASASASASASPTPSPSPSVSPSPSPTSTTSKSNNGVNGKDGRNGRNGQDGADGQNGADGSDGQTPYIGSNGNWWIGNQDTGVSATGQGSGGSVGTSLADVPVGTKFPCYPNKEFDWVDGYSGKTVHISSIVVELTAKNDFDEWAANPDLRTGYSFYSPYTVTAQITGYVNDANSGRVEIALKSNDNGTGASSAIHNDGTFQVTTQFDDLTRVVDIWFGRAYIYDDGTPPTPTPTPTPEPIIPDVDVFIDNANAQLGVIFSYTGSKPEYGFSSSGFVNYVVNQSLREDMWDGWAFFTALGWTDIKEETGAGYNKKILNIGEIKRGDILCFDTNDTTESAAIGIYLGDNKMIHSSNKQGCVGIQEIDDTLKNAFICARRLTELKDSSTSQSIEDKAVQATPTQSPTATASPNAINTPTPTESSVAAEPSTSPIPTEESPASNATGTGNTETP